MTDDHLSFHWNHKNTAGMGYDHRWDIRRALQIQSHGFVQGNFDQTMLFADKDTFAGYLEDYLSPLKDLTDEQRAGWVCGLGHGVLPKTPQYNVKYFVNRVREVFGE
ncbi:MAG: hypothetical protein CL677_03780 [Bdellovibrionaceae bacterium]|nr:hypothetical protein [Pseudobdellovibrionaceae bacterium]